jgi:hypothetical protein
MTCKGKNIYNKQAVVFSQSTREKKVLHMLIEKFLKQAKEEIIMDTVLSDEFMDKVQDNFAPIESLMAYYRCAIMEVETKFNVLNEQFSLQYDRNPIESIKTRVKSFDSILKKVKRKQIPFHWNLLRKILMISRECV